MMDSSCVIKQKVVEVKKNRTVIFRSIVGLCLLVFGLSGCKKNSLLVDLVQEKEFAQKMGDVFIHEYITQEVDDWRGWGWSQLKQEGDRFATYPSSRLRFVAEDLIPLHLFCACRPFTGDDVAAKSIRIELNDQKLDTVELDEENNQFFDILLPAEKIKRGNNWIELFYVVDDGENQIAPLSPEGKRKFSLVVQKLILSSHPDFTFADNYIRTQRHLKPDLDTATLVQKVPGAVDFYIDIPEKSYFVARCNFYPSNFDISAGVELDLEISVQEPGKNEEIFHSQPLSGEKSQINLDSPLSVSGVARLRLKAGNEIDTGTLLGFLVWDDMRLVGQKKMKESVVSPGVHSRFQDMFADRNVVFVIFDAARADHFSSYGHFRPTTPNTDKFAQNSTIFTSAYSEAISTRCSMGTLFTGFPITVTSLTKVTSGIPRELTTIAQHFQSQGFKTTGYTGIGNVASVFRFDRGFDQYFELYKEKDFYRKSQQYLPYVIPWLEANRDKKFFLYIHFKEPHAVYKPLPPFLGMFSGDFEETVDLTEYHEMGQTLSMQQVEYIRACYDENLASADSAFGEILNKLNDLGLDQKTIVILTADHGDLLGENGRKFGHGDYFGEGVMHIPLFIRFPSQDKLGVPGKIDALVKLSDLFATLADGYGFDVPWDLIGGKSLLPLVVGGEQEINPFVVVEKRDRKGFCIRTKSHKLILWNDAPTEFYDLAVDPVAENNIFQREDVMAHYMLTELKKWIAAQELIKTAVLGKDASDKDIGFDQIDKKTLENLKALGYIK